MMEFLGYLFLVLIGSIFFAVIIQTTIDTYATISKLEEFKDSTFSRDLRIDSSIDTIYRRIRALENAAESVPPKGKKR